MNSNDNLFGKFIKSLSYKEQAYNLIKDAILFNKFRIGAVYSQEAICNELGISRTPVREALIELQKEGYISIIRGRGIKVATVTEEYARDILESRLFHEKYNAFLASKRANEKEILEMKKCIEKLKNNLSTRDGQLLYRIDHEFHKAIAKSTKNDLLFKETTYILDNYLRFENKTVYNNSIDANIVFKEHLDILNAIEERNSKKAQSLMEKHLKNSYERTLKILLKDYEWLNFFDYLILKKYKKSTWKKEEYKLKL